METLLRYLEHVPHKRITKAFNELKPALDSRLLIGDGPKWKRIFEALPEIGHHNWSIKDGVFVVGEEVVLTPDELDQLKETLKGFIPWRKGPFNLFGAAIDTEWQSNLKWDRFKDHISSIENKIVLDVGCNNGYYMYRMLEHKPKLVLGIDPSVLSYYQFESVKRYVDAPALHYLPCGLEEMDGFHGVFDTVFSMGILYHRRHPLAYLKQNLDFLKEGGEAIIETITIPGDDLLSLTPEDRYAQMRNVFFLPTVPCLVNWMKKVGFIDIQVVDTSPTTPAEQRDTEWVERKSLEDFLDPDDTSKTVEGYPAPLRTTIIARKRPKQKFSY